MMEGAGIIVLLGKIAGVAGTSLALSSGLRWYHNFEYKPKKKEDKNYGRNKRGGIRNDNDSEFASKEIQRLRRLHEAE